MFKNLFNISFFKKPNKGELEHTSTSIDLDSVVVDNDAQKELFSFSVIFDQSPLLISITNVEGIILYVNSKFSKFLQYPKEEITGKKLRLFKEGHQEEQKFLQMWDVINTRGIWKSDVRNRKKDGTFFWERVIVFPILDESGSITNFVVTSEDVTENKKFIDELYLEKEKAEENNRLKTAFLNSISHQIRTPMNAIVGFANLLNDPSTSIDKYQQFIDLIIGSSKQLLSIITDIVSIASIESDQEKVYRREFKLNNLLVKLHEQFAVKAQKQNLEFSLDTALDYDSDAIWSDETKISAVITNLLSNAFKYTKKGHIKYGYTIRDTNIEFYVEDTGIGISKNMTDDIFKRFRKIDSPKAKTFGGSGLGLAISKAYVEMIGGKIWFNTMQGYGSTFYFTIPYNQIKKNKKQHAQELITGLDGTRMIMIAEDDDSSYELFEQMLSDQNFLIIRATNGIEAVSICKTLHVDLILMDIKMPEMDGNEAIIQIREFLPFVPIIAETGFTTPADINDILNAGCDDYIFKPIDKQNLLNMIQKYLD